jgi:hypothetical protein
MGVSVFPAPAGGGIKSVQRGSAGASGNVTITSVDIAKSFVTVFGSASSGTVVPSFTLGTTTFTGVGAALYNPGNSTSYGPASASSAGTNNQGTNELTGGSWTKSISISAPSVTAGSTTLVSAVVTGFLANATTLTVSGACRYEVVEFA